MSKPKINGKSNTKLIKKGSVERKELNDDLTHKVLVLGVKTVLFICTHNSARSQMAEAFLNKLCGDRYEAKSAGVTPAGLNPYVVKVMAEIGIDLSTHRSKSILEFQGKTFDYVVTVCDTAREACPFFPGEKEIHKSFPDPSAFTWTEEILQNVREVRDEVRDWIEHTFCQETEPRASYLLP